LYVIQNFKCTKLYKMADKKTQGLASSHQTVILNPLSYDIHNYKCRRSIESQNIIHAERKHTYINRLVRHGEPSLG